MKAKHSVVYAGRVSAKSKNILKCVCILLFAGLFLSGCNSVNSKVDYSTFVADYPLEIFIDNGIEVNQMSINEILNDGDPIENGSYFEINGLADNEIEQEVNLALRERVASYMVEDIPPYRGIKAAVDANAMIAHQDLYSNVNFSANNILSIDMHKFISYINPDENGEFHKNEWDYYEDVVYVSGNDSITLDLTTGKVLSLKDLFVSGTDYMSIINDCITYQIEKNGYHLSDDDATYSPYMLISSFTGFKEEPKFAISNSSLLIYINSYDNPEFDTGLSNYAMQIPFDALGENFDILYRSFDPDIYEPEGKDSIYVSLIPHVNPDEKRSLVGDEIEGVYCTSRVSYTNRFGEELKNQIMDSAKFDVELISAIDKTEGYAAYYDLQSTMDVHGRYLKISKHITYPSQTVSECAVYDKHTLEQLSLDDIFVEGFDYKSILEKKYKNVQNNYAVAKDIPFADTFDKYDFSIGSAWIEIGYHLTGLSQSLNFEDFGYENFRFYSEAMEL